LRALSADELANRLEGIDDLKTQREALHEEIITLKNSISSARLASALEHANAAEKAATATLEDARDQSVAAAIGMSVLDVLKRRYQSTGSATLKDAGDRLMSFTNDRYDLALSSGEDDALVAIDRRNGDTEQGLDNLSSNTRAQALIAARLAFLHAQERDIRPPLLIDEALAMADPDGAESVMSAILSEAHLGRQVFYFTAQPNEISEWKTFLDSQPEAPRWLIHEGLGTCQDIVATRDAWQPTALPTPDDGESYSDYARRLQVPAIDPWQSISRLSPYYLLDPIPQLLHTVAPLAASIGEFMAFIERVGAAHAASRIDGIEPQDIARLKTRHDIIEVCLEHWRIGRNEPLTLAYLKGEKLLTPIMLQHAATLLQEGPADPQSFLKLLDDCRGVGPTRLAKLRDDLIASGRISDAQPLSRDAILRRLRQDFPAARADVDLIFPRLSLPFPPLNSDSCCM
jgi:hypothetical protein